MNQRYPIIKAIINADVSKLEEEKKIADGKKFIISSFLDYMKFFRTKDEHGQLIDRKKQIDAGEIEVVFIDPIKTALEKVKEKVTAEGYSTDDFYKKRFWD